MHSLPTSSVKSSHSLLAISTTPGDPPHCGANSSSKSFKLKASKPARLRRGFPSFTLIEVIIAMTLFMTLATFGVMMVSNVSKASKKVEMEEYVYTEGQALLERLTRTIQASGIDYEEYYSQYVLGATTYGINYGEYHKQFFNPSTQFETGKNPYEGSGKTPDKANATCVDSNCSDTPEYHQFNTLFLLNRTGNLKTYFVMENDALALVQLEGIDEDGNGIPELWRCTQDFNCTMAHPDKSGDPAFTLPDPNDATDGVRDNTNFGPLSGQNMAVDSFQVYISPIEDPYKGFNETSSLVFESVQIQPKVTLVLQLHYKIMDSAGNEIKLEDTGDYIGSTPDITLQNKVGT
jgi:type II secretory pathway pseudopilin PulG